MPAKIRATCRDITILALLMLAGCAGSDVHIPGATGAQRKIPAIKNAAEHGDMTAAPQMVKDLESDDPAVRFYAIEGLQRLTGQTLGYLYYDDPARRRDAVMRWRRWLDEHHK